MIRKFVFTLCIFCSAAAHGARVETQPALSGQNLVLKEAVDFHLTDPQPIRSGSIDLSSPDAWLFLDNVRPSAVASQYAGSISVGGKPLKTGDGGNARIAIYKQGAVVIPQPAGFTPLETFTNEDFSGAPAKYAVYKYYTNRPDPAVPAAMALPLTQDNAIRSIRLKRGYMATLANEPDGTGYSRVFAADGEDIVCALPAELSGKVSFVRVFEWQWPSKKGWCGGRGQVVESNGRNKQDNEIDLTQSTWLYSWGFGDPINPDAEFVPMKWGLGLSGMERLNARTGVSHLLGYNEPNRPDQSDMSVEQALAEWPELLKSGLRLGSPSVSDNSRLEDWLYKFMDECDKRNYRVDYVTVHAYWGFQQMRTAEDWYRCLREIHRRTGRPIWITEWNNGANWTQESWPSRREDQFAKQVFDLKNIIMVLDTASFVERYSIYNWVEDKRAMIIDSCSYKEVDVKKKRDRLFKQTLTPAGEFYRGNHPPEAYNARYEYVPRWNMGVGCRVEHNVSSDNWINLRWLRWDVGSYLEMIREFRVERSTDGGDFQTVAQIAVDDPRLFSEPLPPAATTLYRIRSVGYDGVQNAVSNTVACTVLKNDPGVYVTNLSAPASWSSCVFASGYASQPVVIAGTPTNRNKFPQTVRVRNLSKGMFDLCLDMWEYLGEKSFAANDTVAVMVFPSAGAYDLKGIQARCGTAQASGAQWNRVTFEKPFAVTPVVLATQVSDGYAPAASVRVRNVTPEGFEVTLQYEAALEPGRNPETVCFAAITPGKGSIGSRKIEVGHSDTPVAGNFFNAAKVEYGDTFTAPAFFGAMQGESDGVASGLRIKSRGAGFTEVFKEQELSKGSKPVEKESLGWIVIETTNTK